MNETLRDLAEILVRDWHTAQLQGGYRLTSTRRLAIRLGVSSRSCAPGRSVG